MENNLDAFYKNKKVLVAGGTGTIGIPVVKRLRKLGALVTVVSLDSPGFARAVFGPGVCFIEKDLTEFKNCLKVTRKQDFVFNLVGLKGSVGIGETKIASYFVPMLLFQTNLMEAAFRNCVKRYLFTSSICAYPQSTGPKVEDRMWDGMPRQNDRFPGLAKRIGEAQAETYLIEHGWKAVRIVRPSNVYGPFDDFNPKTAQVIPSLITRMLSGEDPVRIWGDGSAKRDFIFSEELAYWMLVAMKKAPPCLPINLGSGHAITIKELSGIITGHVPHPPRIEWDTTKPTGDAVRFLSIKRARDLLGFKLKFRLDQGISRTIEWYLKKRERYYGK